MLQAVDILFTGLKMVQSKPNSIVFEFYEIQRSLWGCSKEYFFDQLNDVFQHCKTASLKRFEKGILTFNYIFHPITREEFEKLEKHFNDLEKQYKDNSTTQEQKPKRFDVYVAEYNKRGDMTKPQRLLLAKQYGFEPETFADYYTRNYDKIKKAAAELK